MKKVIHITLFLACFLAGCEGALWNSPYPGEDTALSTYYTSFSERPKHLDPARSYSSNEWAITNLIYEAPLQYHYLKRPFALMPALATQMPTIEYLDKNYRQVKPAKAVFTRYRVQIKPGVYYQPHPAFAQAKGRYLYHHLEEDFPVEQINDFSAMGTREVVAEDFVRAIKRLADPNVSSPIYGLMSQYIIGLDALRDIWEPGAIDALEITGANVLGRYEYEIITRPYPQFIYWLALPFFAPMPEEVLAFYQQVALQEKNITLDWWPVGTGPYHMIHNNPSHRITLAKNPNFHGERYPEEGEDSDIENGLLQHQGETLPFIEEVNFILEKESIPRWQKFLQGYYDASGVSSDSFDQALQLSGAGEFVLSDTMKEKGITLLTSFQPSTYYWGFNMLDPIVGGDSERARKLRQAISIAIDTEEYIQIFLNGRALPAQGLIPPGLFGHQEDYFNPVIYKRGEDGHPKRRSIEQARILMEEAGYLDGIDPNTQQALQLYYDTTGGGSPDAKATFAWMQKQFSKIGIELIIRDTQYNRFQDKMSSGTAQFFGWGWNADYPDPENFLFLLYGPNSKALFNGENASNYQNEAFDQYFQAMKNLPNGSARQAYIEKMTKQLERDAPWVWGYHPKAYTLLHAWTEGVKPHAMSRNTLKYHSIDGKKRLEAQKRWNKPYWGALLILFGFILICLIPPSLEYWRRERRPLRKGKLTS